jgi:hypothetical protein
MSSMLFVSLKGHFDEEKRWGEAVKMTFED